MFRIGEAPSVNLDNLGCSSLVPRALQARASWPGSPSRVWSIVPYPLRFPPAVSTLMAVARGVPPAPGREKKIGLLKEQNNRRLDAPWDDHLPSQGLAPCGLHPRIECPVCLAAGIE